MSIKNSIKIKAVELRRSGHSFKNIAVSLKISKSTVHEWTKSVTLSSDATRKILIISDAGRLKGRLTIKNNSIQRDKTIENSVEKIIKKIDLNKKIAKLICAILYWGEGEKSSNKIAFTNSDPSMVKVFFKTIPKQLPSN